MGESVARRQAAALRESWRACCVDLLTLAPGMQIGKYVEAFEEGSSFKEVERKMSEVVLKRSKLEGRKRAVTK